VPAGGSTAAVIAPALAEVQAQDPSAEDPEKLLDLAGQQSTEADLRLMEVYGNTTHRNDGRHLHGGIAEDELWQRRYDCVVANSHKLYLPPQGKVGKAVVTAYTRERVAYMRGGGTRNARFIFYPVFSGTVRTAPGPKTSRGALRTGCACGRTASMMP